MGNSVIVKGKIEPADVQGVSSAYTVPLATEGVGNANYKNTVKREFTKEASSKNKGDVTQPRAYTKA